ncbi:MAG: peroxidase family protein [Sphingomonadaceae bacterium]
MRWSNIFDQQTVPPEVPEPEVDVRTQRTADGSYNDLEKPWMGMSKTRFGRNLPLAESFAEKGARVLAPNPRTISNKLLARREFVPVPHINLLAAGWLQFMVHDWFSHGPNAKDKRHHVPIGEGDDWEEDPMVVLSTEIDPPNDADAGRPDSYTNMETHWWDGSQIYGSDRVRQKLVRSDPRSGELLGNGKLWLSDSGHLPVCPVAGEGGKQACGKFAGQELAGVTGNWWVALSVLQTLFAREHNAIVDRLALEYPHRDGEWLFQKARLVTAALMAKIHTMEWTPALMNSPAGRFVMRANWWGFAGERFRRGFGRLGASDVIWGIAGSPADHHAAPYAMTEEFVACYRMHSLIPDHFSFRRARDDGALFEAEMAEVSHGEVSRLYERARFEDIVYSLGTSHPGALVLHNFPNSLRKLSIDPEKGIFNDVATIDILRDRERGIPRYCRFRRLLGMKAPRSFDELTTVPEWRRAVAEVYDDIEDVDLLVGTLCEASGDTPPGFGFSSTVFRIFILMASRRLQSDRFYTDDFRPEIYTPEGFEWIADNGLASVVRRHCPELADHFAGVRNPFFPWRKGAER